MGVHITTGREVCLYDSTTGRAFGRVFTDAEQAAEFIAYAGRCCVLDVREAAVEEFDALYDDFVRLWDRVTEEEPETLGAHAAPEWGETWGEALGVDEGPGFFTTVEDQT